MNDIALCLETRLSREDRERGDQNLIVGVCIRLALLFPHSQKQECSHGSRYCCMCAYTSVLRLLSTYFVVPLQSEVEGKVPLPQSATPTDPSELGM